jgi:hypothetical protein
MTTTLALADPLLLPKNWRDLGSIGFSRLGTLFHNHKPESGRQNPTRKVLRFPYVLSIPLREPP